MPRSRDAVLVIGGRRAGKAMVVFGPRPAPQMPLVDLDKPATFEFEVAADQVMVCMDRLRIDLAEVARRKRSIDEKFGAGSELARMAYVACTSREERVMLDQVSRMQAQATEAIRLAQGMERRAEVIRGRDFAHRSMRTAAVSLATPEAHKEMVAAIDRRIAAANRQLRNGARENPQTLKAEPLIRGGRSARRAAARHARRLSRQAITALRDAGMEPPRELLQAAYPPIKFLDGTAVVPERKPVNRTREEARRRTQAEHAAFNVVRTECEVELRLFFARPEHEAAAQVIKRELFRGTRTRESAASFLRRLHVGRAATCTDAEVAAWARFSGWISTPDGQRLLGRFVEPLDGVLVPPAGAQVTVVTPVPSPS